MTEKKNIKGNSIPDTLSFMRWTLWISTLSSYCQSARAKNLAKFHNFMLQGIRDTYIHSLNDTIEIWSTSILIMSMNSTITYNVFVDTKKKKDTYESIYENESCDEVTRTRIKSLSVQLIYWILSRVLKKNMTIENSVMSNTLARIKN